MNNFVILNRQSIKGVLDSKRTIDNNIIVFNTEEYSLRDLEPIRDKLDQMLEQHKDILTKNKRSD